MLGGATGLVMRRWSSITNSGASGANDASDANASDADASDADASDATDASDADASGLVGYLPLSWLPLRRLGPWSLRTHCFPVDQQCLA